MSDLSPSIFFNSLPLNPSRLARAACCMRNCVALGRAEKFASQQPWLRLFADATGWAVAACVTNLTPRRYRCTSPLPPPAPQTVTCDSCRARVSANDHDSAPNNPELNAPISILAIDCGKGRRRIRAGRTSTHNQCRNFYIFLQQQV